MHKHNPKAHNAVSTAVRYGKMPHVSTLKCQECGKQAQCYHHHKGYAEKHWLDVVPLCNKCHWLHNGRERDLRLSDDDVRNARKMYHKDGMSVREIASIYNYDKSNMLSVIRGQSYKWVE